MLLLDMKVVVVEETSLHSICVLQPEGRNELPCPLPQGVN